jgi:hypothetical protein
MLVMALAVVHEHDPDGADRRRYLALLLDGLRPGAAALPEPSKAGWRPKVGGPSTVAEL